MAKNNEYIVFIQGYGNDYIEFIDAASPEAAAKVFFADYAEYCTDEYVRVIDTNCAHEFTVSCSLKRVK